VNNHQKSLKLDYVLCNCIFMNKLTNKLKSTIKQIVQLHSELILIILQNYTVRRNKLTVNY